MGLTSGRLEMASLRCCKIEFCTQAEKTYTGDTNSDLSNEKKIFYIFFPPSLKPLTTTRGSHTFFKVPIFRYKKRSTGGVIIPIKTQVYVSEELPQNKNVTG